jgi:metallo-beta-lactamase superfamily protein
VARKSKKTTARKSSAPKRTRRPTGTARAVAEEAVAVDAASAAAETAGGAATAQAGSGGTAQQTAPAQSASEGAAGETARGAERQNHRAKVRMYRQGLGDCFLISLPRNDGNERPFYVMIDCGVVLGTPNPGPIMKDVMDNIVHVTGGNVDILIATHAHWDHVSGFVQAADSFAGLKAAQVWLAWTENDDDELTKQIKKDRGLALSALRMGLSQMQLGGDADDATELGGILEFFGAARGPTTDDALESVRAKAKPAKPRYCLPTDPPVVPDGTDARFYVLGPPYDWKMLRKINPSSRDKETYLALDGLGMFMDGAGTALGSSDESRPFDQQYEIPFEYAKAAPELDFFRRTYWQPNGAAPDAWRRIDTDWLGGSTEMALQLDSLTNNTSLVIAIEFPDGDGSPHGDVLLFAADAQVGNWLSWQDRVWTVGGKTVTGPDLLSRTILYKVGHHGSHNATLREKGLEQMTRLRIAMLPVDHDMAVKKRWGKMPLEDLTEALAARAKDGVLRVDKPKPAAMQNVVEEKLFFEVTF